MSLDVHAFRVRVIGHLDATLILPREHGDEFAELLTVNGFAYQSFPLVNAMTDGIGWAGWVFQAGGAGAALTAASVTLRAYVTRRKGNSVILWRAGEKIAEIKGDLSANDIVKVMSAVYEPPTQVAEASDDDRDTSWRPPECR
jgi:hypothetical protein